MSEEQQAIVHNRSERLRVLAFAGTGKTTTLRAYARARPQLRMLYLAFNRTVAAEARGSFPANVTCSTIHSLAYRAVGYRYRHQLQGQLRAYQVAVSLGLDPALEKDLALAHHALTALQHFLCSGGEDLAAFGTQLSDQQRYPIEAMRAAERLWELMADPRASQVPMLHDGYLKLYQLSDPRLRFDVILLDEAQDTNPVTLAILERQSCATVFVGDPHQQIYLFRHATNAMAMPGAWDELALTGSFRFGEEIAAAANRLLLVKGESRRVRGLRQQAPGGGTAFIARGNAALFQQAVDLAKLGTPLYWCGGIDGYRHELLLDLWHLRLGETSQIRDRFIAGFKSYSDLCVYSETQDVRDLKAWCHLLDRLGNVQNVPEQIAGLRRCAVGQVGPGVVALSTAHKAKGLEFAEVELADDFHDHDLLTDPPFDQEGKVYERETTPMLWDDQGYRGAVLLPEEELNLRYVAVTRAEAVCRSKLWPAPLFADMAAYVEENPRFLLVALTWTPGTGPG